MNKHLFAVVLKSQFLLFLIVIFTWIGATTYDDLSIRDDINYHEGLHDALVAESIPTKINVDNSGEGLILAPYNYSASPNLSFANFECPSTTSTSISVTDNFTINDLTVGLIVDMDSRHHFQATLTSPMGTSVILTSINSHGFVSGLSDWDIQFDDASSGSLNDGNNDDITAPNYENDRTANPEGTLADFDGENANGVWTLAVCDYSTSSVNGGTVVSWKLDFDGNTPCSASGDTPVATQGTCNGSISNNDAAVSISNIVNSDRADISSASANTYDGDSYASAETVAGGTISFTGLAHGKNYIIRIYETGGGCFTDVSFASANAPTACPNIPSSVPWTGSVCNNTNIMLQNGIGALTCGVTTTTTASERWAFALMNFDDIIPISGRSEETSEAEVYHHPSWHIDSIGNVFGIAMNTVSGDILLTASSNYGAGFLGNSAIIRYGDIGGGTSSGDNDSGAGGVVYVIDGTTGQASVFANLPQQSISFTNFDCESSDVATRTNSGVGLGNIVYDEINNQYFVSNIEDGRIYRLDNAGAILDSYDPFNNDDGVAGISDLEELVYGLAIEPNTNRLFFGGVDNTTSTTSLTAAAGSIGIHSITLTASGGFPGTINNTTIPSGATYNNYESTEFFHTNLPVAGGTSPQPEDFVYLISDLEFNANGELIAGIRVSCNNSFFSSYNHFAEVNIVTENTGTGRFNNSITELDITATGNYADEDTYGGVASYINGLGEHIIAVSSSDILNESGPHGIAIFDDPPNSGPITPLAAVAYGVTGNDPKGIGGDVNLWTECYECNLNIVSITPQNCMEVSSNNFEVDWQVIITYSGRPTGNIAYQRNDGTISSFVSNTSPDTITISGIPADGGLSDTIKIYFASATVCADTFITKRPLPCPNDMPVCAATSGCLGGNTFEDFNCNGVDDTNEPGVQGVQVVIYDCDNMPVDTVWTDNEGDWQICGLTDGAAYRVEFILPESIACWATPTHAGSDNGTDIQFLTVPACTKFSLSSPADYCERNPPLSVVCYLQPQDATSSTWTDEPAIVQIPYESGTTDMTTTGLATLESEAYSNTIATNGQIGSVFGLATDNINDIIYTTSFMKRHVPFGPSGPGAIYKMEDGMVTTFLNLNTLLTGNPAGVDGHSPSGNNYQLDDIWDEVGKTSFGDLLITPDGKHLYTVTLTDNDRKLYRITIPTDGNSPTAADIESFDLPSPDDCPNNPSTGSGELNYNIRPGALGYEQGKVYVGLTCTAESTQNTADLKGYVYEFNSIGDDFSGPLLTIPFNYDRQDVTTAPSILPGNFYPWNANQLTTTTTPSVNGDAINASYPMPWLMDINFSDDGCMILGITDRFGHLSSGAHNPPAQLNGNGGGDILKACNLSNIWTLESNGNDGVNPATSGAGTNSGPGNGEFFFSENFETFHNEISNGGFAIIPGQNELVLGVYDPAPANGTLPGGSNAFDSGGLIYLNTADGSRTRSYMLFNRNDYPNFGFDKASATGGIVINCEPAPLEIGNYVWCDSIENGIQDACESGIDNMIVQLYNTDGDLIGQDTTVNGNYYFNQDNVDTTGITVNGSGVATPNTAWSGMDYATQYFIVFGNGQYSGGTFIVGSETYSGITSMANAGTNDNIDSDVDGSNLTTANNEISAGLPFIDMTTEATGCGNHQYDMGVTCVLYDWGDLPDASASTNESDYQTIGSNNGPVHQIIAGLNLGSAVDGEADGQPDNDALGDGVDEDGLTIFSSLDISPGSTFKLPLSYINTTGMDAQIEAWLDWNNNGEFDSGEMIFDATNPSITFIQVTVPNDAVTGEYLGLRIRISNQDNMTPYGLINSGEVEDYLIGLDCPTQICLPISTRIQRQ